ncbi:hypothetical protein SU67_24100, partial [Escherichia coli O139:H28 str. E24377A]
MITLFHEFGHGLHHMLTRIETAGVSGISGVPWDAVELPSSYGKLVLGAGRRWRLSPVTTKPAELADRGVLITDCHRE